MKLKKTKIVCTMGPSTDSEDVLKALITGGMNVCRFNFSHGRHQEHKERMDRVKKVREALKEPIAILLDTKGPEIRTGIFESPVQLYEGDAYTITMDDCIGNHQVCTISYKNLINDVKVGDIVLIDDGLVALRIVEIKNREIHTIVENSGIITSQKGINLPGVSINLPAITQQDVEDIKFGILQGIDFIAASFVRKVTDVLDIRKILEANNAGDIQIISKIENHEGVQNIDAILQVSDGIMVARGDMGVEIPGEEVPLVQKMMIKKCNEQGKPVIIATQMLDSMTRNPRPTRAEVTDVANAIFDGADAIMLSGETAVGKYPVESLNTMARIALKIEETQEDQTGTHYLQKDTEITITDAISHATCTTARDLNAKAIITSTSSGYTTRMVSKFRPSAPIIAATPHENVMRRMALLWGTYPIQCRHAETTDEVVAASLDATKEADFADSGDIVVVTAGLPVGKAGKTNLIRVCTLTE